MGSSNLQCAISKETIAHGDKTVTLIIEPVKSSDGRAMKSLYKTVGELGELFKINSLPIKGVYEDYGRSIALSDKGIEIALCKQFYGGYDYSEKMGDDWGSRGYRLNRGEPVSSYFDTNTSEFVVLKDVYDIVIKSTKSDDVKTQVKDGNFDQAFKGAIDAQLLGAIKEMKEEPLILETALFLKGLSDLGIRLAHTPSIAAQMGKDDFEMSKGIREQLITEVGDKEPDLSSPELFCLLTKEAIESDSIVYVSPVLSNRKINSEMQIASYDNYSVKSLFNFLTSPIACHYSDKKLTPVKPLSSILRYLLIRTLSLGSKMSDEELIEKITARGGDKLVGKGFFKSDTYFFTSVMFSEKAYNVLNSKDSEEHNSRLLDDMNIYIDTVVKLLKITERKYHSIEDFIDVIKKLEIFNEEKLDSVIQTIKIFERSEKDESVSYRHVLRELYRFMPSSQDKLNSYSVNEFYERVIREDSQSALIADATIIEINKAFELALTESSNINHYEVFLQMFCKDLLSVIEQNSKLLRNLSKAAVVILPSDIYHGSLTVVEQQALMGKINSYSYQRCLDKIKEFDDDEEYDEYD